MPSKRLSKKKTKTAKTTAPPRRTWRRLTLARRAGADTLRKLEAAAGQRFREAEALYAEQEWLGAIYLYGYSVEIRLKAAYYRTIGLAPSSTIGGRRKVAEGKIGDMRARPGHPVKGGPAPGHHIMGWLFLLEQERSKPGNTPMVPALAGKMHNHAGAVFDCWVESLRYRCNKPYDKETKAVRDAAKWFRANSSRLWR